MANTLSTGFNAAYWTPKMQETFFKESVALGIANTDLRSELRDGDTLHKPYGSYPRVQTYTKGTDITVKDIGSTDDTLTVSTAKVASFYVDEIDSIQNKYDAISEFATMAQRQLNNVLDQAVLAEYSNAGTTLDAAAVGGSAGSSIALSASNIPSIFTAAARTLNVNNRLSPDRFALISPRMLETLQNYVGGRETAFGEIVSENGKVGNRFGFSLRLSNNLPFSATLTTSSAIANTETVSIAGVTFTFKDAAAVNAGEVYSGGSDADTTTQLVAAINGTGTESNTTYRDVSAENRQLLESAGIVAVDGTTTITITGYGDIVVAETMGQAANVWSVQKQFALFGITGAIDLVTQKAPSIEFRDAQLRLGKFVHPWMLYGKKTFTRNQKSLVAVQMDASSWV
jgi:hypothetical protein